MSAFSALLAWPRELADRAGLALWTSDAVAAAVGGVASEPFAVSGVAYDSREVHEGDLFFALTGEQADGHAFLDQAFSRGAAAAVVDRPIDMPHVLVKDTLSALELLASAARGRVDAAIVGVTGSAGKTGVKEALYAALDRGSRGRAHRSVKSYNNHVGVPLSLARMPARTAFGVFEMGMNHPGELAYLTRIVRPHVAIVTTIAPAHIGFFTGEEQIADAKGEIFEGLEAIDGLAGERGGVAIIPADNPHYERLRAKAARHAGMIVSFGRAAHADVRVLDTVAAPGGGTLVTADMGDRRICYTVSQPGDHWVLNSLAVMAAVRAVGGDLGAAGLALAEMEGLAGRGARHIVSAPAGDGSGEALLIDESYNANPASMRATIAQLGITPARRRVAVLGAMRELGEDEARYHAELSAPLFAAEVDRVVLVGDEMAALADALGKSPALALGKRIDVAHVANASEALAMLRRGGIAGGDAILVKGSNSVGLGAIVRALTSKEG
ncbi:UDP-N-acetylmuramoyl-tripeptide--D-alanyl-D-alanine ligase [Novosphingobium tardum]|uniref:UDP-N-acetylmuramoyl-tripeptide--D-alanyl-D-alanine ligase n=1 Tax=Novosphingobium tardum TaxID=1538021 RepID=A0ABV8RMJ7_9SPHN